MRCVELNVREGVPPPPEIPYLWLALAGIGSVLALSLLLKRKE